MDPIVRVKDGRRLGNAAAAGQVANLTDAAFRWYVREEKPNGIPAPKHVEIDQLTSQRLYDLDAVAKWNEQRPGKGNWQGLGAKYRRAIIGSAECPWCHQLTAVDDHGEFRRHFPVGRKRCPGGETVAPGFEHVAAEQEAGGVVAAATG